ncbi:hypothetical protein [Streptomyces chartreusis]|uniref:hypothetical protein n=1 Tax=Streptomyces chartreusis TaxID=1969 RepID=UPI0036302BBF
MISLPFAIALDNLGLAEVVLARPRHGRRHLIRALAMKRVLLPPGDAQIAFTERALAQADAAFGLLRFPVGRG